MPVGGSNPLGKVEEKTDTGGYPACARGILRRSSREGPYERHFSDDVDGIYTINAGGSEQAKIVTDTTPLGHTARVRGGLRPRLLVRREHR